nr:hypothetical protein [Bacteroidota bacterium]
MHWTPKVACKRNGDFIITWSDSDEGSFKDAPGEIHKNGNHSLWSNPQGSKSYEPDVYAQMYAADGSPLGENFMVNNETGFSFQMDPAITVDSAGNFIIAWEDNRYNEYDIFFQRYAGDGTPLGGNVRAEGSQYSEFQFNPTIASDPAGNFIIAWSDQRNGDSDIYGQRYSNAGSPIDENFLVNTDSSFTQQSFPCISVAPNGNFIISWTDRRNGNDDVYAQRYLADGTPFGNNYMISNTGQLDQTFPAVTLGESLIFTAWQDNRDGQMGFNIWANVMDWDFTVGIENNPAAEISPLPYLHQNYPNPF